MFVVKNIQSQNGTKPLEKYCIKRRKNLIL